LVSGPERTILAFLAALAVPGTLWLWLGGRVMATPVCVWKACTGWPCFGCGGTRSVLHLLAGDWAAAWSMNPGVCLVMVVLLMAAVYSAAVVAGWLRPWRPEPRVWRTARWVVAAGLTANWLYLLAAGRV
jgi:hypothetical protein